MYCSDIAASGGGRRSEEKRNGKGKKKGLGACLVPAYVPGGMCACAREGFRKEGQEW
jgi:hypothetical protein